MIVPLGQNPSVLTGILTSTSSSCSVIIGFNRESPGGLWPCGSLSQWALQAWGAPCPWSPRQSGSRLGTPWLTPSPGLLKGATAPRLEAGAGDRILIDRKHMKQIALSAQEMLQNNVHVRSKVRLWAGYPPLMQSVAQGGGRRTRKCRASWLLDSPSCPACRLSARQFPWGQAASGEGPTASLEEEQRRRGASRQSNQKGYFPL